MRGEVGKKSAKNGVDNFSFLWRHVADFLSDFLPLSWNRIKVAIVRGQRTLSCKLEWCPKFITTWTKKTLGTFIEILIYWRETRSFHNFLPVILKKMNFVYHHWGVYQFIFHQLNPLRSWISCRHNGSTQSPAGQQHFNCTKLFFLHRNCE